MFCWRDAQTDEEMSQWDDAMADLAAFGCSPGGALMGTSPLEGGVMDVFGVLGGLVKPEGDDSTAGQGSSGQTKGKKYRGGRGGERGGSGGSDELPEAEEEEEEENSDEQAGVGAVMDDDELAEMADTLLLLHGGSC